MADAGTHINGVGKLKARLKRSRDYRKNGYTHIKGSGRKSAYADLDVIQAALQALGTGVRGKGVSQGSKAHARRYTFTYGLNFKVGKSPYSNQGHHLLPEEGFTPKFFTDHQLRMLRGVDYDVNNGENIIFLPTLDMYAQYHQLPIHSGSHPAYTRLVDTDMVEVRKYLNSALARDKKHKTWNPPDDLKGRLMGMQDKYWDLVVDAGPIAINKLVKPTLKKVLQKRPK